MQQGWEGSSSIWERSIRIDVVATNFQDLLEICGHNINNFDASMLTKMKIVQFFFHIFILMHTIFYFSTYKLDVDVDTKIFPPNRCFGIQAQQICGWHNL